MAIDGIGSGSNIANQVRQTVQQEVQRRADPLNLFGNDTMNAGGGSGLFPNRAGGTGSIEDILASLSKKDKNNSFDTSNAANGLFKAGTDMASGAASGAMQGIQQAVTQMLGQVMSKILPAIMGMLGGL